MEKVIANRRFLHSSSRLLQENQPNEAVWWGHCRTWMKPMQGPTQGYHGNSKQKCPAPVAFDPGSSCCEATVQAAFGNGTVNALIANPCSKYLALWHLNDHLCSTVFHLICLSGVCCYVGSTQCVYQSFFSSFFFC